MTLPLTCPAARRVLIADLLLELDRPQARIKFLNGVLVRRLEHNIAQIIAALRLRSQNVLIYLLQIIGLAAVLAAAGSQHSRQQYADERQHQHPPHHPCAADYRIGMHCV